MSRVFFCSDLHLGHKNICKYRTQFSSVEEHDAFIKDRYHSVVGKNDKVYFLGDVFFTHAAMEDFKTWEGNNKVLVCGNHDLERLHMSDLVGVYKHVQSFTEYRGFWLTHCPIHPCEMRKKKGVIHGHTHNQNVPDWRYFNVSMENIDYTPIQFDELVARFEENKRLVGGENEEHY